MDGELEVISDFEYETYAGRLARPSERVRIDAVKLHGHPALRFQMPASGSVVLLDERAVNVLTDSLRYFGDTGRWERKPPLPLSNFSVSHTMFGFTVRWLRQEFFFIEHFGVFTATKTEWERRGYKVLNPGRYDKSSRRWNGQHYVSFALFEFDRCQEIGGKKASYRRLCFKNVVQRLINMKADFSQLVISPPLGWDVADK